VRSNLAYGSAGGAGNGNGGGYGGGHSGIGSTPGRGTCDNVVPNPPSTVGSPIVSNAIFFGGSGSSSGSHTVGGRDGAYGGTSGGIILLFARNGVTNLGKIGTNGGNGENGYAAVGANQPMGGGGGGAGGLVWIRSGTTNSLSSAVQLAGGIGGAALAYGGCSPSGAGGSGGVGRSIIEINVV
jgi:hypothetical protein